MREVFEIIDKAMAGGLLSKAEIEALYAVDPFSKEAAVMQWAAYTISQEVSGGVAEVHAQLGLDATPCAMDCEFCSFAKGNEICGEHYELSMDEIMEFSYRAAEEQVGYVLFMTTAGYRFDKLLEVISRTKEAIGKDYPVLACCGDVSYEQALQLKDAGCNGAYHALRLDEGVRTSIDPSTRKRTVENYHKAGLKHCTTLEPIGPEHTPEQLAELTIYIRQSRPVYGGAWRRGSLEGSARPMRMINESQTALYTSAFRLAAGPQMTTTLSANSTLLARAGANAVCAEAGTNPRDVCMKTEEGCGLSIADAKTLFRESGWTLHEGPVTGWLQDFEGDLDKVV